MTMNSTKRKSKGGQSGCMYTSTSMQFKTPSPKTVLTLIPTPMLHTICDVIPFPSLKGWRKKSALYQKISSEDVEINMINDDDSKDDNNDDDEDEDVDEIVPGSDA